MFSLGIIIYLFAKAMPRVNDVDVVRGDNFRIPQWMHHYLERIDELLARFSFKNLRRAKIGLLKINNWVDEKLKKFKKEPLKDIQISPFEEKEKNNELI